MAAQRPRPATRVGVTPPPHPTFTPSPTLLPSAGGRGVATATATMETSPPSIPPFPTPPVAVLLSIHGPCDWWGCGRSQAD